MSRGGRYTVERVTKLVAELPSLSATRLAELIRKREVSSEEVVRAHVERIEDVNPRLNAVVLLRAEQALAEARACDESLARGQLHGPLHGVPMTVKDSLEMRDTVSTSGTVGRRSYRPPADAATVALMREAGAVVLGKTNVPELCLAFESDNLLFGRTNNPYDAHRTAGGSSGGESAIIAAGGSPIGLGSDAGGSVRVPAHFCGIASIKPTSGRLPKTGHFMPPGGPIDSLWQVGPMARAVEDLILSLPILAKPDWRDASVVPMPVGDPKAVRLDGLRIALYTDNGVLSPYDRTADVVVAAASSLMRAGAHVTEARPAGMEPTVEMWFDLLGMDGGLGIRHLLAGIGTTEVHPIFEAFMERLALRRFDVSDLLGLHGRWDQMRRDVLGFIRDFDLIVCPAAAGPAVPHGSTLERIAEFSYTMTYNLAGLPAAVVRFGTSVDGLPIGIQLVARPWCEHVALAAAAHLEAHQPSDPA